MGAHSYGALNEARKRVSVARLQNRELRVVGIAGSLRRASFNLALLRAAQGLTPSTLRIEIEALDEIPMFNADLELAGTPASVRRLRDAVGGADGLLLATPEYNHGVPGVLKNAIDWLSQPVRASVLNGKPTAIIGASTGPAGTARGQSQLRQSFVLTNTPVMLQPEILVGRAQDRFDPDGRLRDEDVQRVLAGFLTQFEMWILRHCTSGTLERA
jgi:chromate reductase